MAEFIPAITCPADPLETIGDMTVPLPSQVLPVNPRAEAIRILDSQVPMTMSEPLARSETARQHLLSIKLNEHHGRSVQLDPLSLSPDFRGLPELRPRFIWQQGNVKLSSISLKGNDATSAEIIENSYDPYGLAVHGLLTTASIGRILKAAEVLNDIGVTGEQIIGVFRPQQLPYRGEMVDQTTLKKLLALRAIDTLHLKQDDERYQNMFELLAKHDFVVLERAMLVPDRICDIQLCGDNLHQATDMLRRTHTILRAAGELPDDQQDFDLKIFTAYLFTEHIPHQLGRNLRLMHVNGLRHRMLHPGNISLAGEIVDYDSVVGPAIGLAPEDKTCEPAFLAADFREMFYFDAYSGTVAYTLETLARWGLCAETDYRVLLSDFMQELYNEYYIDGEQPGLLPRLEMLKACAVGFCWALANAPAYQNEEVWTGVGRNVREVIQPLLVEKAQALTAGQALDVESIQSIQASLTDSCLSQEQLADYTQQLAGCYSSAFFRYCDAWLPPNIQPIINCSLVAELDRFAPANQNTAVKPQNQTVASQIRGFLETWIGHFSPEKLPEKLTAFISDLGTNDIKTSYSQDGVFRAGVDHFAPEAFFTSLRSHQPFERICIVNKTDYVSDDIKTIRTHNQKIGHTIPTSKLWLITSVFEDFMRSLGSRQPGDDLFSAEWHRVTDERDGILVIGSSVLVITPSTSAETFATTYQAELENCGMPFELSDWHPHEKREKQIIGKLHLIS